MNKALYDASVYTNVQGLKSLTHEYTKNSTAVKKEVAQQFESLLVQILIKSMRDTNKEYSGGLMTSDESGMYNDMFDKQLSLAISKSGVGLSKTIEQYIDKSTGTATEPAKMHPTVVPSFAHQSIREAIPVSVTKSVTPTSDSDRSVGFESASDFVKNLWGAAKHAADRIGADPKILLAQAALETNWGKSIIPHENGASTNNLFNIKADSRWDKEAATFHTIEEKDGVLVKEKSKFRAYDSYDASFIDFTQFLQHNPRYSEALKNAHEPEKFVQSLQKASYATDSSYSQKIMSIYNSPKFNKLFEEHKLI